MLHTNFVGKVEVGHVQVAAFSAAGEQPRSFAELLDCDRNVVVNLDGRFVSVGLTWNNALHVQGTGEHEEAVLPLPLMESARIVCHVDPQAPDSFRTAMNLLFAIELDERASRLQRFGVAQAAEQSQSIELTELVLPRQLPQPGTDDRESNPK